MIPQPGAFWADKHEAVDLASLIEGMPVAMRVKWLRMCCMKYSELLVMKLDVINTDGGTKNILADFYTIVGQNGLTLEWATGCAEYLRRGLKTPDAYARAGGLTNGTGRFRSGAIHGRRDDAGAI